MNKKIQSFIVILFTIFCVSIMLFSDQINNRVNLIRDKILVIDKNNKIHNKDIKLEKQKDNVQDNNGTQKTDNISKKTKAINDNTSSATVITEKYKKFKMDRMNEELEQDKESFFAESDLKDNINKQDNSEDGKKNSVKQSKKEGLTEDSNKTVNGNDNPSKRDIPVFKVSRAEINDSLTLSDKAKLLSIASKLSAVDYEKVRKYLESGTDEDVKKAIKLLKERLSEKDYDRVKEVAKKVINMDVVEQ